ncbi:MAG: RDD family protein [Myxococcota bacterium]
MVTTGSSGGGSALATLAQRMWSALVDGMAITLWVAFVGLVQPWPDDLHGAAKAAIWFLPPVVIEPVSIRTLGHTAGQGVLGLRVYSLSGRSPSFARLLLRQLVKVLLLGLSVFYVPFTRREQGDAAQSSLRRVRRTRRHSRTIPGSMRSKEQRFGLRPHHPKEEDRWQLALHATLKSLRELAGAESVTRTS